MVNSQTVCVTYGNSITKILMLIQKYSTHKHHIKHKANHDMKKSCKYQDVISIASIQINIV